MTTTATSREVVHAGQTGKRKDMGEKLTFGKLPKTFVYSMLLNFDSRTLVHALHGTISTNTTLVLFRI